MATEKHIIDIEAKDKGLKEINAGLRQTKEEFIRAVNEFGRYSEQAKNAESRLKGFIAQQKEANRLLREVKGVASLGARGFLEMAENITTVVAGISVLASKVSSFVQTSLSEFTNQQNSLLQLEAVTGKNADQFERLKNKAAELQGRFGIADEETQSVQAYLLTQGRNEKQIDRIIHASRLLAIVQGTDLKSAVEKVDGTFEGVTGKLGKLDSRIKDLSTEELENGRVAEILIEKYNVLGDSIENSAGTKLKRLEVGFKEFKEGAGEVLFDAIQPLVDGFNGLGFKADEVGKIVVKSITGIGTVMNIVKTVVNEFKALNLTITDLITSFGNMTSNLPLAGSVFQSLTQFALDYQQTLLGIIGLQNEVSSFGASKDEAKGGTKFIGKSKELTANSGNLFKGSNKSGSRDTDKKKELNFLEQLRENVKKLQDEIINLTKLQQDGNIAEYERLRIMDEMLKKQAELNLLKKIGLTGLPDAKTIENPEINIAERIMIPAEAVKEMSKSMADNFMGMLSSTQTMLQSVGLMETGFGRMIAMLSQFANGVSAGFDIVKTIISFIPGLGGLPSGLPNPSRFGGGNSQKISFNPQINIKAVAGMRFVRDVVKPNLNQLEQAYVG